VRGRPIRVLLLLALVALGGAVLAKLIGAP
jgi:hypothetical protein